MPTEAAKAQSFSLANMVPQAPESSQRAWSRTEQLSDGGLLKLTGMKLISGLVKND